MASSGLKQVNAQSNQIFSLSFTSPTAVVPDAATSPDRCSPYVAQSQRTNRPFFYKGLLFVDREDPRPERPRSKRPNRLEGVGVGSVHEGRHRDRTACPRFERCRCNFACVRLLFFQIPSTQLISSPFRQLHSNRPPLPDVPAVYFVAPTLQNVRRIAQDLEKNLYESFHLNFVEPLSRALLEELAAAVAKDGTGELITQVGSP